MTRRKPRALPANPGRGHDVGDAKARVNLCELLAEAIEAEGHRAASRETWVALEGDFDLLPQVVTLEPRERGDVRTSTTVQVEHPLLGRVFEFQHADGAAPRDAFRKGFSEWARRDLPVFLDALAKEPTRCSFLELTAPGAGPSRAPLQRRVVLGPPLWAAEHEPADGPDEHPFCPCCLFTNSQAAFDALLGQDTFFGIRLFASRSDGETVADCRVNGEDFPAGEEALIRYAKTWPERGFEYRKQYVCIQSLQD